MSDLYEADILEWCEHQVGLLRRVAAGEPVNEPIDWPNVIEEVEAVGRSQLSACESLLLQALIHLLKGQAWPTSKAASHSRGEVLVLLFQARSVFSPSMRQRIDFGAMYRLATKRVLLAEDDSGPPNKLPDICPWTFDELLSRDIEALAGLPSA